MDQLGGVVNTTIDSLYHAGYDEARKYPVLVRVNTYPERRAKLIFVCRIIPLSFLPFRLGDITYCGVYPQPEGPRYIVDSHCTCLIHRQSRRVAQGDVTECPRVSPEDEVLGVIERLGRLVLS